MLLLFVFFVVVVVFVRLLLFVVVAVVVVVFVASTAKPTSADKPAPAVEVVPVVKGRQFLIKSNLPFSVNLFPTLQHPRADKNVYN